MKTSYTEVRDSSGNVTWSINDVDLLETDWGRGLVQAFLDKYPPQGDEEYTLSVYMSLLNDYVEILEVQCSLADLPAAVGHIYKLENAKPMTFFGVNQKRKCYAVGLDPHRGILNTGGTYRYADGILREME